MAISRARKEELVAQYDGILKESDGFVILEYAKMPVSLTEDLRNKLREAGGQYVVTKNTLFSIALEQNGWPVPSDLLKSTVSVAFGKGNFPGIAKEILDFVDDIPEQLQIKGGVMGVSVLSADQIDAVSKMPTLDELRAQLVGILAPPASLVGLLVQPTRDILGIIQAASGTELVNVLRAYVDKNSEDAA